MYYPIPQSVEPVMQTSLQFPLLVFVTGLDRIQVWLRESLKRRLHKSLACDWMRPENVKYFSLRKFYVQLEWKKKVHHVLSTEKVTLHSIHELIELMTLPECSGMTALQSNQGEKKSRKRPAPTIRSSNVIVEGKTCVKSNKNIRWKRPLPVS